MEGKKGDSKPALPKEARSFGEADVDRKSSKDEEFEGG